MFWLLESNNHLTVLDSATAIPNTTPDGRNFMHVLPIEVVYMTLRHILGSILGQKRNVSRSFRDTIDNLGEYIAWKGRVKGYKSAGWIPMDAAIKFADTEMAGGLTESEWADD